MNLRKYGVSFLIIVSTAFIGIITYSLWSEIFLKIISLSIVVAIASFSSGGILGFIFGLPSYKNSNEIKKHSYERNNSLKEIADWITKIIVGLALVELKKIIRYFGEITNTLGQQIEISGESGSIFIGAIILSFFIIGFVSTYLFTITDLFKYLVRNNTKINSLLDDSYFVNEELKLIELKKDSKLDDVQKAFILEFVRKDGKKIKDIFQSKKLSKALYLMEEYSKCLFFLEKSSKLDPDDISIKTNIAFIQSKYLNQAEKSNRLLISLIEKFPENAILHYNLSCNYNREFRALEAIENAYKDDLEKKMIFHIKKALTLEKGLLPEALKDKELENLDILTIFNETFNSQNQQ